jgi:hypothetical protein
MESTEVKLSKGDHEFVRIIAAASALGDGRQRHIRAFKRLVSIIEKLEPRAKQWPKVYHGSFRAKK